MERNLENSRRISMRWFFWTLLVFLLAVLLFQAGFFIYYRYFFSRAEKEFNVPGLNEDFVPQGLESCGGGHYLISGYIADTGESRIYYVTRGGKTREIRVCRDDGSKLQSHSGGICVNGPFTYMAGGNGNCYVLSSADLFDGTSNTANVLGVIKTRNAASFCCLRGDNLLVGEYEYGDRFQTPVSHHLKTPAGDENRGLIFSYPLNGNMQFGVDTLCNAAYSVPSRIQGMCFTNDGRMVLSASCFRTSSQLLLYNTFSVLQGQRGIYWVGEHPIPLYYMDSTACENAVPLPPFAEQPAFENGRLLIVFESASSRFHFGKLVGGQYVYSLRLPAVDDGY